ncbi:MAG: YbaB/EbfC family nucleoid-associated protein [Frankiaceae bacterium]
MQGLLQQALHMQAQLATAQDELAAAQVEGSAGGGLVSARMTGVGELVGLVIDPAAVDPDDTETLADLVLAAVRDATRAARRLAEEKMGGVTAGMTAGLSVPGFGPPGLGLPGPDVSGPDVSGPDVSGPDAAAPVNSAGSAPPDLT